MKSSTTTNTVITLVLSHEEAKWLNALMQNPLDPRIYPDDEPSADREMRIKFFEATKLQGEGK